jgi:ATP-dependent Lhr-like helicase
MQVLVERDDARVRTAFEALADHVRTGRQKKHDLEKVDGEAVVGSDLEPLLVELGFRVSPRRLTLTA